MNLKLFRPSDGPALELCTHFERTVVQTPNQARGDQFHRRLADIFRTKLQGKELTPEMAGEFTNQCDWALSVQSEVMPTITGIESEVTLYDSDHEFITSGTVDLYGTKEGRPVLIDWKTGQERNYTAQLAVYGTALLETLNLDQIDIYVAFVDQQRLHSETLWLHALRDRVNTLIESVCDPASPYAINGYCAYCNNRGTCPAWDENRSLVSTLVPEPNLGFDDRLAALKADPEKLSRFIVAYRRLKSLVEKTEKLDQVALKMIQDGATMPGLCVISRKGFESVKATQLGELIMRVAMDEPKELDSFLTVDLEESKKLWGKYMRKKAFPKTQFGTPTQYLALKK